jgi:hypothetical protein
VLEFVIAMTYRKSINGKSALEIRDSTLETS